MAVTFSGKWVPTISGINFEAHNDGDQIVCEVSHEALQDIQPGNIGDTPEQQFLDNQYSFQTIATTLIEAGEHANGVLQIHSRHVVV